jgi:hypothetical protein
VALRGRFRRQPVSVVDGRPGFAAYGYASTMAVIDLQGNEAVETLLLGELLAALPTADNRYVIAPNIGGLTVSIASTETLEEGAAARGGRHDRDWFETTR